MSHGSQIANVYASPDIRRSGDASFCDLSQYEYMDDSGDKNGGPNHLGAWMAFRKIKGAALAKALKVTPGMVSDLVNSNRALSAKWLRRIAPHLETTPGMLLDHDPHELDSNVIDIWLSAGDREKRQITAVAAEIVRTGTGE